MFLRMFWFDISHPTSKRITYHYSFVQNGHWRCISSNEGPELYVQNELPSGTHVTLVRVDYNGDDFYTAADFDGQPVNQVVIVK